MASQHPTAPFVRAAVPLALLCAAGAAQATDGYFANGYGMKAIGMGGAAVATALEPNGGAVNPAAMSFLGTQWQLGLSWFSPDRSASRTGSGPANIDGSATSGSSNFFIPEFGFNWRYRDDLAFGVTVYGNGGMNTDYPGGQIPAQSACAAFNPNPGPYNLLCGNGSLGVDAMQLVVAPYAAWQFMEGQSIGIAPLLAYQRFSADGLQAFDNPMLSTAPGQVTNRGHADSWGAGLRLGYMGRFGKQFALGASYATKTNMSNFDDYAGLFAQAGGFDIPSSFTLGGAFRPTDAWLIALDFQRIFYSDVMSVHNPSALIGNCAAGDRSACLGGGNGAGFGWQDINVWKLGVQVDVSDQWTLRAGYNYSGNPVKPADVTFNILAPGIVQNQWTAGASWRLDKTSEISAMFMVAQKNSVSGTSLFVGFGAPPTTTETVSMKEMQIGIAYTMRY